MNKRKILVALVLSLMVTGCESSRHRKIVETPREGFATLVDIKDIRDNQAEATKILGILEMSDYRKISDVLEITEGEVYEENKSISLEASRVLLSGVYSKSQALSEDDFNNIKAYLRGMVGDNRISNPSIVSVGNDEVTIEYSIEVCPENGESVVEAEGKEVSVETLEGTYIEGSDLGAASIENVPVDSMCNKLDTDTESKKGKVELKYIIQRYWGEESEDKVYRGKTRVRTVYVSEIDIEAGSGYANRNRKTIPKDIKTAMEIALSKVDRSIMNIDGIKELKGEKVKEKYESASMGYFLSLNSNLEFLKSTVKRILEREGNSYLVEVEKISRVGVKGKETALGRHRAYVRMVLNDSGWFDIISNQDVSYRIIEDIRKPDNKANFFDRFAIEKSNEMGESKREEIQSLLEELYLACEAKKLRVSDGDVIEYNGKVVHRGMYDLFNVEGTLELEIIQSTLREPLIKGEVVSIRGEIENILASTLQAEVMVKEVIEYKDKEELLMDVYYVIEKEKGVWSIVERRELE